MIRRDVPRDRAGGAELSINTSIERRKAHQARHFRMGQLESTGNAANRIEMIHAGKVLAQRCRIAIEPSGGAR